MDFNEARLYEVTMNLHMHALIFFCLSASVDGKQHLSEVVFSALVGTTGAAQKQLRVEVSQDMLDSTVILAS